MNRAGVKNLVSGDDKASNTERPGPVQVNQVDDSRKCGGDAMTCGLFGDDCCACQAVMRAAPGQPGSLAEQFVIATTPRLTPEQAQRAELEEVVRRLLVDELPAAVRFLMAQGGQHAA